jgi:hypothetical protein
MPERREGKVVQIIGSNNQPNEVVVNLGSEDGITEKAEFLVYTKGAQVKDPDTGEDLGDVEIVRGRGQPKHIQPRLTTIIQVRKTKRRLTGLFVQEQIIEDESIVPFSNGTAIGDLVRVIRF